MALIKSMEQVMNDFEKLGVFYLGREKNNPENKCKFIYGYGFGGLGRYEVFPFVVMSHYNYLKDKLYVDLLKTIMILKSHQM